MTQIKWIKELTISESENNTVMINNNKIELKTKS